MKNIILFGKIPPPIGGVTISVKNLMHSLKAYQVNASIFSISKIFKRFDCAHIHYSIFWKRAIGVLIGKFIARKVIFTVHGKYLDTSNIFNRFSVYIADGIILLNEELYSQFKHRDDKNKFTIMPSLFSEGLNTNSDEDANLFTPEEGIRYLLLYAYDRTFNNNEEIYGVEFILNNLDKFSEEYKIVLLDLSGKYESLAKQKKSQVIYINRVVNFFSLLRQIDIYIRPTCMDGASVAVQEALINGTPVLASDVVDRPKQVVTYQYKNIDSFMHKLSSLPSSTEIMRLESVQKYLNFCENL